MTNWNNLVYNIDDLYTFNTTRDSYHSINGRINHWIRWNTSGYDFSVIEPVEDSLKELDIMDKNDTTYD